MSFFDIDFKVPGNPKALKRHRSFQKGKFKGTYDPSQNDKADFLAVCIENKPKVPFDEPLHVSITFCFARPKNHYRTGANAHLLRDVAPKYHIGTPDMDNLEKFVADSLNGIFWKDDSRICSNSNEKIYGEQGYIRIRIARINQIK
jgi:Holliday junction resolvase RusA-like endonuclease